MRWRAYRRRQSRASSCHCHDTHHEVKHSTEGNAHGRKAISGTAVIELRFLKLRADGIAFSGQEPKMQASAQGGRGRRLMASVNLVPPTRPHPSSVERRSRGDAKWVANDCSPSMSPRAQEPKMCTVLMSVWRTGDVTFALVAWRCYNGPPLPQARGSSQSPLHWTFRLCFRCMLR